MQPLHENRPLHRKPKLPPSQQSVKDLPSPSRGHNRSNTSIGPSFHVRVAGSACPQTSARACGEYWLELRNRPSNSPPVCRGSTRLSVANRNRANVPSGRKERAIQLCARVAQTGILLFPDLGSLRAVVERPTQRPKPIRSQSCLHLHRIATTPISKPTPKAIPMA
jgi:hypothetical protein